ncbi:MAG: D-alanine--D-alanine ligase, partial [Longicatena sp.]
MRLRVVVAFGGESVEHEISIISAHQVMAAMDVARYEIIPLYIA